MGKFIYGIGKWEKSKMAAKITICKNWPVFFLTIDIEDKFIISFLKKWYLKYHSELHYMNHNKKQLRISIALNTLKSKMAAATHLDILYNIFDIGCIQKR